MIRWLLYFRWANDRSSRWQTDEALYKTKHAALLDGMSAGTFVYKAVKVKIKRC